MKYSSGNHRKGKGRNNVTSHGTPISLSPEKYLESLEYQIIFAEKAGLNVRTYLTKKEELLAKYPHLCKK